MSVSWLLGALCEVVVVNDGTCRAKLINEGANDVLSPHSRYRLHLLSYM